MNQKALRTTFAHPTPELPVEDVERAQRHYCDALGFEIAWLDPSGDIGAVRRDDVPIFFRRRTRPFEPAVARDARCRFRAQRQDRQAAVVFFRKAHPHRAFFEFSFDRGSQ